jgi:hypothetical protein
VWKDRGYLEGADKAKAGDRMRLDPGDVATLVEDLSTAGLQKFGDQVEAGGLARAIRADESMDGAAPNVEVDSVDGREPSKRLGQTDSLQDVIIAHLTAVSIDVTA